VGRQAQAHSPHTRPRYHGYHEERITIMKTVVGKWGNSLAVRIPAIHAKELNLDEGDELEMTCVNGALLLCPTHREYTLAELLEQIKPENIHGETDWGQATGREAW